MNKGTEFSKIFIQTVNKNLKRCSMVQIGPDPSNSWNSQEPDWEWAGPHELSLGVGEAGPGCGNHRLKTEMGVGQSGRATAPTSECQDCRQTTSGCAEHLLVHSKPKTGSWSDRENFVEFLLGCSFCSSEQEQSLGTARAVSGQSAAGIRARRGSQYLPVHMRAKKGGWSGWLVRSTGQGKLGLVVAEPGSSTHQQTQRQDRPGHVRLRYSTHRQVQDAHWMPNWKGNVRNPPAGALLPMLNMGRAGWQGCHTHRPAYELGKGCARLGHHICCHLQEPQEGVVSWALPFHPLASAGTGHNSCQAGRH